MRQPKETPAPLAGPLHLGYWDGWGLIHGWRPRGTKDWLLLYTELGHCLARYRGRGILGRRRATFCSINPARHRTTDNMSPQGRWKNVWAHWVPRVEVLEWLSWPELSPGLRHLHLPPELRRTVLKELVMADSTLRSNLPRGELLATNALERALLFCARANPREGDPHWSPRIQQAVDHLAKNLRERHSLESIARRFGFSRSRFAALFRAQVGRRRVNTSRRNASPRRASSRLYKPDTGANRRSCRLFFTLLSFAAFQKNLRPKPALLSATTIAVESYSGTRQTPIRVRKAITSIIDPPDEVRRYTTLRTSPLYKQPD